VIAIIAPHRQRLVIEIRPLSTTISKGIANRNKATPSAVNESRIPFPGIVKPTNAANKQRIVFDPFSEFETFSEFEKTSPVFIRHTIKTTVNDTTITSVIASKLAISQLLNVFFIPMLS
jgi:hypothetical protein